MTKEARVGSKSEAAHARQPATDGVRSISGDAGREQHPLLHLQQLAGNRAVQRLVAGRPRVVQRVLSPETAAMGRAATGDLLSGWAGASLATIDAAQQAGAANTAVADLLTPITMVQAALVMAEVEPAPGGGAVTPVTPTPVPVPAPSQQVEE